MADPRTPILRPHQRRAQAAILETSEEDLMGSITPPSLDTLEGLERQFPARLPDFSSMGEGGRFAEATFGSVQRQLGQQDVIQFLRNLIETSRGA